MATTTTRLKLPIPDENDPADGPVGIGGVADALDPIAAVFTQGATSSRPAAGTAGRFYFDVTLGALTYDTGTDWVIVSGSRPGDLKATAVTAIPAGWLLCDGSVVLRSSYPALFSAIGTLYGAGDGSTTFGLPDYRGRALVGAGAVAGDASRPTARTVGQAGGEQNHTLSVAEMPSHNHGGGTGTDSPDHAHTDAGHAHGMSNPPVNPAGAGWSSVAVGAGSAGHVPSNNNYAGGAEGATSAANAQISGATARHAHGIAAQGSGSTHNNMPPFAVANVLIKT